MEDPTDGTDRDAAFNLWLREQRRTRDRFDHIRAASERHRIEHGSACTVYPTGKGPLLGVLAAATQAQQILEIGCGLGYSALWLAHGASPDGTVTTVEPDEDHAELARRNFAREGYADRITVREGRGAAVLADLPGPYDLIFCDCDVEEYHTYPAPFMRLLRPAGVLYTANLFAGWYSPDMPGLDQAVSYRNQILDDARLMTAFLDSNAVSVRLS